MTDWRQTTLPRFFHQHQASAAAVEQQTNGGGGGGNPTSKLLGARSKSQDAIRNHRKTVRFVSDKQEYQPILDSTTMGMGCNSRPNNRGGGGGSELGQTGKGRSFFLLSMLQGGDPSSSSGRAKSSKVTTFLHFFFARCHQSLYSYTS